MTCRLDNVGPEGRAFQVIFQPSGRRITHHGPILLTESARSAGVLLESICGGKGECGRCKMVVKSGKASPLSRAEQDALAPQEIEAGYRLGCCTEVRADTEVFVPDSTRLQPQRLQTDIQQLADNHPFPDAKYSTGDYGVAVDLGTTKIALYLIEMHSGKTAAEMGIQNPQIPFGEDVMSRLEMILRDSNNQTMLSQTVIEAVNDGIGRMCQTEGIDSKQIIAATVVGNTVMHHILLGLPIHQLALSPFAPAGIAPLTVTAAGLGMSGLPSAHVYFPPPIAGFVGSDHLAMILAVGMERMEGNLLGIDIGTNTEVALKTPAGITCCSTASGPAFEGAGIDCGMRASPGAIEHVAINKDTLEVNITTIAGQKAVGICGSGIVEAIAEMLKTGIIDERGKLQDGRRGVHSDAGGKSRFLLARTDNAGDIVITQRDIARIQLAKGAIRCGIETLLHRAAIPARDIDAVFVAGAFGSYLDPSAMIGIGLLPDVPVEKISQVGNAAGAGAIALLLSTPMRHRAEALARKIDYVELFLEAGFHHRFAQAMRFT